jgi:hypothetical protein
MYYGLAFSMPGFITIAASLSLDVREYVYLKFTSKEVRSPHLIKKLEDSQLDVSKIKLVEGTTYRTIPIGNRIYVKLNSKLVAIDPDAANFISYHEFGHVLQIQNCQKFDGSKCVTKNVGSLMGQGVVSLVVFTALNFFMGSKKALFFSVALTVYSAFKQRLDYLRSDQYKLKKHVNECDADFFAVKNASIEELKGGWRALYASRFINLSLREGMLLQDPSKKESCPIDEFGDLINNYHPRYLVRMEKIESELLTRLKQTFQPSEEDWLLVKKIILLELADALKTVSPDHREKIIHRIQGLQLSYTH